VKTLIKFRIEVHVKILAKLHAVPVTHKAQIELDQFRQQLSFLILFSIVNIYDIQEKIIYNCTEIREV
jgi:hypothetical protein